MIIAIYIILFISFVPRKFLDEWEVDYKRRSMFQTFKNSKRTNSEAMILFRLELSSIKQLCKESFITFWKKWSFYNFELTGKLNTGSLYEPKSSI